MFRLASTGQAIAIRRLTSIMERNSFWKVTNRVPIVLITFYRRYISPLTGPSCRFYPTCSRYAIDAFEHHNFFYALYLTVWRVLRCNPFSKGGYDPVPLPGGPTKIKEREDNG